MLRSIKATRVWIYFNGEDTIQRVIFEGDDERLLVMFESLGIYNKEAPKAVYLKVNCGGFIVEETPDGDMQLEHCFLVNQENRVVLADLEADITALVLRNHQLVVVVTDGIGDVDVEYPNANKRKGLYKMDGKELQFHVWELPRPIPIIVDDESPFTG